MEYTELNSKVIDSWVQGGWEWGTAIDHDCYLQAQQGKWEVVLTPTKAVPRDWFGELKNAKLLGLASGGGQQMPIFAAAGATVTVLDYSEEQLNTERMVAGREGYEIETIKADMTKRLPFEDESFDIIFHPVSNCFVEDVSHVFNECFRVLKKGGVLLGGYEVGYNYIFDDDGRELTYPLPYNPLKDEELYKRAIDTNDGMQFSHTLEEQIGCQLKAGFIIQDIYEDTNGSGRLHDFNIPCFISVKSLKPGRPAEK